MLLFRIAFRNLIRRGRKTMVVSVLIAAGVASFFVGNAILESSIGGIQTAFSDNFTSDLSVSARSDQSFSIFGPDIPVIGDYESAPLIVNAADVGARVSRFRGIAATAYVFTTPLSLEAGGAQSPGLGLGVIGEEYFSFFRAPRFILGGPPAPGSSDWAVITEEWAAEISSAQGHPLLPGDKLQLSFFRNQTFTIRVATLVGVIRYQPSSEALRHVLIADGRIIRALSGYSQTDRSTPAAQGSETTAVSEQSEDLDSLFSGTSGTGAPADKTKAPSSPISVKELKDLLNEAHRAGASAVESALGHDGPWHFILARAAPGVSRAMLAAGLRRELAGAGMEVQVRDWRGTAGGAATYVFLMQIVLYVGMFMLAGIVLILTMNALVMSVFERAAEIGTMRAIGAQRHFVRALFAAETSSLTLASGIIGTLAGILVVRVLDHASLHFHNQILILLFGGATLHPGISFSNIILSVAASLLLGMIAWVYPLRLALRIQPVRAIQAS